MAKERSIRERTPDEPMYRLYYIVEDWSRRPDTTARRVEFMIKVGEDEVAATLDGLDPGRYELRDPRREEPPITVIIPDSDETARLIGGALDAGPLGRGGFPTRKRTRTKKGGR